MLLPFSISMTIVGIAWYISNVDMLFLSLFFAIITANINDISEFSNDTFLLNALKSLKKTPCCILSEAFNDPAYVLRWTMALRTLTGIFAATSVLISWYFRSDFATGHYLVVSGSWCIVCICWILSCVPLIISLMQCAAATKNDIAIRYRKIVFVWILHDIFLGLFWLYLSIMLYDLADDNDDSEWRTIFLSMLSWHIIILVLHRIYMKGTRESKYHNSQCSTCCGVNTLPVWLDIFLLLSFVSIYMTVIARLQQNNLMSMGMSDGYFVLYLVSVVIAYFCKKILNNLNIDDGKNDKSDRKIKNGKMKNVNLYDGNNTSDLSF